MIALYLEALFFPFFIFQRPVTHMLSTGPGEPGAELRSGGDRKVAWFLSFLGRRVHGHSRFLRLLYSTCLLGCRVGEKEQHVSSGTSWTLGQG